MTHNLIYGTVEHPAEQHVELLRDLGVDVDLAARVADLDGDVTDHRDAAVAVYGLRTRGGKVMPRSEHSS